jgi:hypothetical protein
MHQDQTMTLSVTIPAHLLSLAGEIAQEGAAVTLETGESLPQEAEAQRESVREWLAIGAGTYAGIFADLDAEYDIRRELLELRCPDRTCVPCVEELEEAEQEAQQAYGIATDIHAVSALAEYSDAFADSVVALVDFDTRQ